MNFLGIGPVELIAILLLVLIVFQPEDLANTGRMLGKRWRKFKKSELFGAISGTERAIKKSAHEMMGGQDLDQIRKELAELNIKERFNQEISEGLIAPSDQEHQN